jgi:hypothetical protein
LAGGRIFGRRQVYMKALFEYFRDDLGAETDSAATRSAVDLAEFQEDAVKKAAPGGHPSNLLGHRAGLLTEGCQTQTAGTLGGLADVDAAGPVRSIPIRFSARRPGDSG